MLGHDNVGEDKLHLEKFWHIPDFLLSIIPFALGLILVYVEGWGFAYLFLFPSITWFGTLFFCILHVAKESTQPKTDLVSINPLSSEKQLWQIFLISTWIQIIFLLILGWDATVHPQLMDNYAHFFILPVLLIYCFTWFWLIWFSITGSNMIINNQISITLSEQTHPSSKKTIISTLSSEKKKNYVLILIISWIILLILIITDGLIVFLSMGTKGLWIIEINLPVDSSIEELSIFFSGSIFLAMILIPSLAILVVGLIIRKVKAQFQGIIQQLEQNPSLLENSEKDSIVHGLKSFKI